MRDISLILNAGVEVSSYHPKYSSFSQLIRLLLLCQEIALCTAITQKGYCALQVVHVCGVKYVSSRTIFFQARLSLLIRCRFVL